jgi:hypothetical protein
MVSFIGHFSVALVREGDYSLMDCHRQIQEMTLQDPRAFTGTYSVVVM